MSTRRRAYGLRFITTDVDYLKIHSAGGEWYRQLPVGIQNLAAAGPPHRSPITPHSCYYFLAVHNILYYYADRNRAW